MFKEIAFYRILRNMPRKLIDYSNTHFYKIVCNDLGINQCYVGHTTDLVKRRCEHKNTCNNPNCKQYNHYVYSYIRANGGWENWNVILIETKSCKDAEEARIKEREFIEKLNATLNQVKRPFRSQDEKAEYLKHYYNSNKLLLNENHKEYYQKNRGEIGEYARQYYQDNKQHLLNMKKDRYENDVSRYKQEMKLYREKNHEKIYAKQKEWVAQNKEHVKQKQTLWHEQNKERIRNQQSQPHLCRCGSTVQINNKARHERTKKHQAYLNNQASDEHTEEFLQTTQDN